MMLRRIVAIPVAGAILTAAWASAQDNENQSQLRPVPPEQVQPRSEGGTQGDRTGLIDDRAGWQNPDQMMASCITIQNQEEVALAAMAQDKLQNEEAKKFATMLIEQHQAYLTKLEKFAPEAARQQFDREGSASQVDLEHTSTNKGLVRKTAGTTTDERQEIRQVAGTEADQTARSGKLANDVDMLQIHREIAQECLNAAKSEMQEKQGIEADQCFLGHQIAKHGAMKAQLTVFQRHASPELAEVFAEGAATAEKHKNEAEDIMKNLTSSDPASERRIQRKETREERREDRRDNK